MSEILEKPEVQKIYIDARGPRFSATITALVLATALVTQSAILIAIQLVVFAIGAFAGPAKTPYAFLFKKFVKPRLKGAVPTEDARPPRFAQSVGLIFAVVALAAAFLNAAFNYCLGCEMYLLIVRFTSK